MHLNFPTRHTTAPPTSLSFSLQCGGCEMQISFDTRGIFRLSNHLYRFHIIIGWQHRTSQILTNSGFEFTINSQASIEQLSTTVFQVVVGFFFKLDLDFFRLFFCEWPLIKWCLGFVHGNTNGTEDGTHCQSTKKVNHLSFLCLGHASCPFNQLYTACYMVFFPPCSFVKRSQSFSSLRSFFSFDRYVAASSHAARECLFLFCLTVDVGIKGFFSLFFFFEGAFWLDKKDIWFRKVLSRPPPDDFSKEELAPHDDDGLRMCVRRRSRRWRLRLRRRRLKPVIGVPLNVNVCVSPPSCVTDPFLFHGRLILHMREHTGRGEKFN